MLIRRWRARASPGGHARLLPLRLGHARADAFRGLRPRVTQRHPTERPLESYLDGHYARLRDRRQPLSSRPPAHILLAACERDAAGLGGAGPQRRVHQHADRGAGQVRRRPDVCGPVRALSRCGPHTRRRPEPAVRDLRRLQRLEWLPRPTARSATAAATASTSTRGTWKVDCGAIHGVPTDPRPRVTLALYPEDDQTRLAGPATPGQVGAQTSDLTARTSRRETSAPLPRRDDQPAGAAACRFVFEGGAVVNRRVPQAALDADGSVGRGAHGPTRDGARRTICVGGRRLLVARRSAKPVAGSRARAIARACSRMRPHGCCRRCSTVAQWERSLALQNRAPRWIPRRSISFCAEPLARRPGAPLSAGGRSSWIYLKVGDEWKASHARLKVRNRTGQTLHVAARATSPPLRHHVPCATSRFDPARLHDAVRQTTPEHQLLPGGRRRRGRVDRRFKLIVSTEQVDGFLLVQGASNSARSCPARATRAIGTPQSARRSSSENEWFTKDLRVKVVRRLDEVGATGLQPSPTARSSSRGIRRSRPI